MTGAPIIQLGQMQALRASSRCTILAHSPAGTRPPWRSRPSWFLKSVTHCRSTPTCGCRKRLPPGRMRRGGGRVSARAWRLVTGLHVGDRAMIFRLVGLKLIFLIVTRAVSVLGLSRRAGVVEGRRDPDVAPSARCRPARAASRSFEVDVAGPGVAGPARRDAASRPAGRDAADRHSRHDLAVVSQHRPPPLGAAVAPRPLGSCGQAGARSVVTSTGIVPARSARMKKRRAAARSRLVDSRTSMTWPCWSTAR